MKAKKLINRFAICIMYHQDVGERALGQISKVNGPFIIASNMNGAQMYSTVKIGSSNILGKIVKLSGDTATIQCFGSTNGFAIGDKISHGRTWPGLMGNVFDGIQNSLIPNYQEGFFIPQIKSPFSLNHKKYWQFIPCKIKQGDYLRSGDIFGYVQQTQVFTHSIMIPPNCEGKVTYIASSGEYTIQEQVIQLERNNVKTKYFMSHRWPVRKPRPTQQQLQPQTLLWTGKRVVDGLFPLAMGGKCAYSGIAGRMAFSSGLMKDSKNDAIIFVGCAEKGTQMTDRIQCMAQQTFNNCGRSYSLMNKSTIIANSSNMAIATREKSIFTGVTIAEYFRDMGKNVLLMTDSLSRWAESLRQSSVLLSEMPGDLGYSNMLNSRLSSFYEKAGLYQCLGSPTRSGSITIVGSLFPNSELAYKDPVEETIKSSIKSFYYLDRRLAAIMHFPEISWIDSYSSYDKQFQLTCKQDPQTIRSRTTIKQILNKRQVIEQKIQQFKKQNLSEKQTLILAMDQLIKCQFLQQNIFSSYDFISPPAKTIGMMRCITKYYECANKLLQVNNKLTFKGIKKETDDCYYALVKMKFQDPRKPAPELEQFYKNIQIKVQQIFKSLLQKYKSIA